MKTIASIDPDRYKEGEVIDLHREKLKQTVVLDVPFEKRETHQLASLLQGFPLGNELLKMVVQVQ